MRLIDADKLERDGWELSRIVQVDERTNVLQRKHPMQFPEAVVRCKDCKWHEDEELGMVWCPNEIGNWVKDDWFCADGERREDEAD